MTTDVSMNTLASQQQTTKNSVATLNTNYNQFLSLLTTEL